ncbi:MAG: MFS transporter [Pseudomonadota bacterium]
MTDHTQNEDLLYSRKKTRIGKLPWSTMVYQGVGALPDNFQNFAFNTFLLFYYNQVLGLTAAWASFALMLALIVDALSDPMVGSFSDNLKSKWGRRHPLMFASALPMGICIAAVFLPPAGLSEVQLFAWLLVFAIATRLAQTFFEVPWGAIYSELTEDYEERSALVTIRFVLASVAGLAFVYGTWTFIFPSTEVFPKGQLNPDGYSVFAGVLGLFVFLPIVVSTALTRSQIPYMLQPSDAMPRFSILRVFTEVLMALKNPDYRKMFFTLVVVGALWGTGQALELYVNTYFWGFGGEQLGVLSMSLAGAFLAFALVVPLQRRFDKSQVVVCAFGFLVAEKLILYGLRIYFDVLPPNGDPLLLTIIVGTAALRVGAMTLLGILAVSMVADTLDAQELATGRRQEGIFASARSLAGKATTGLGVFISGLLLTYGLAFPTDVGAGGEVSAETVNKLALIDGVVSVFFVIPLILMARYRISRAVFHRIHLALAEKRATGRTRIDVWVQDK